jgi:hypothetical protein
MNFIIIYWPRRVLGKGFRQICHCRIANKSQSQQGLVYDVRVILVSAGDWNNV